jgi:hypothetical protein
MSSRSGGGCETGRLDEPSKFSPGNSCPSFKRPEPIGVAALSMSSGSWTCLRPSSTNTPRKRSQPRSAFDDQGQRNSHHIEAFDPPDRSGIGFAMLELVTIGGATPLQSIL